MAREKEMLSDTESVEKPVREQFQKATINQADTQAATASEALMGSAEEPGEGQQVNESRGRHPKKKRSFEEDEEDTTADNVEGKHRRKRSRDSTLSKMALLEGRTSIEGSRVQVTETQDLMNGKRLIEGDSGRSTEKKASEIPSERPEIAPTDGVPGEIASPKVKRSRLHMPLTQDEAAKTSDKTASKDGQSDSSVPSHSKDVDREEASTFPFAGISGNTSAASPFGALGGGNENGDSQKPLTSFATSGFAALSESSTSGFGSIGKNSGGFGSGGSFATGNKSPLLETKSNEDAQSKNSDSGSRFGGSLRQQSAFPASASTSSGFGTGTSIFGTLGQNGGFGGALGASGFGILGGSGLSSFASGKPSTAFASSSKPSKAFGASAEDGDKEGENDDDDDDEAGVKSPISQEEDKQDERFYHQDLETGEEDEVTEYSCRAKLYNFAAIADGKKEWRERGLGILRLNVTKGCTSEGDEEAKKAETEPQARFLMRADGSHRVVLNTPIKKEIKFGAPSGGAPQGNYMYFMGTIDKGDGKPGGLELLQLKMKPQFAQELYDRIVELQAEM